MAMGSVNRSRDAALDRDLEREKLAAAQQTTMRGQDMAMEKSRMDDATTRLGQGLSLVQDLAKPMGAGFSAEKTPGSAWAFDQSSGQYGYKAGNFDAAKSDAAMYSAGLPTQQEPVMGMRQGGPVQGPKGLDRVAAEGPQGEPIRLNDGEYILPAETVEALGGIAALDKLVKQTTGQAPVPGGEPMPPLPEQRKGLAALGGEGVSGFALGGMPEYSDPRFGVYRYSSGNPALANSRSTGIPDRPKQAGEKITRLDGSTAPLNAVNQERRQRSVFGRDPVASDPAISNEMMAALPKAETQWTPRGTPNYTPEAIRGMQSGLDTVARMRREPQVDFAALDRDMAPSGVLRQRATAMRQGAPGLAQMGPLASDRMQGMGQQIEKAPAAPLTATQRAMNGQKPAFANIEDAMSGKPSPSKFDATDRELLALQPGHRVPTKTDRAYIGEGYTPTPEELAYLEKGETVTDTGITSRNSKGRLDHIFKGVNPNAKEGEARVTYSGGGDNAWLRATRKGFNEDFQKGGGNYVGDPTTGKGINLPQGLNSLTPQETRAAMSAYGPARQAMANETATNAKTDMMRQWKGKDLSQAPVEVQEAFGRTPDTDTLVNRYLAQTLSPEGQQQRQRHEQGLAALRAQGRNAGSQERIMERAQQNLYNAHMAGSADRQPNPYAYNAAVSVFKALSSMGFDPMESEAQAHQYATRLDDSSLLEQIKKKAPKLSDEEAQAALNAERIDEYKRIQLELMEMMQQQTRQAAR